MKKNKIAVFIDEGNVWSSYKSLGKLLNYNNFQDFFQKRFNGKVFKIFFYKAYPQDKTRDYSLDPQHKFMTFLKKVLVFGYGKRLSK